VAALSVAVLGAVGIAVATALPAMAVTINECEVSHPFCIGAPSLSSGQPVKETAAGRNITLISSGQDFKLRFDADTTKCVLADISNNVDVIVGSCSASGSVWSEEFTGTGNNHRWGNIYEINHGHSEFLTGSGTGINFLLAQQFNGVQVFTCNCA